MIPRLKVSRAMFLLLFFTFFVIVLIRFIPLAAAYKAKGLCSALFISERDPAEIVAQDLDGEGLWFMRAITSDVDLTERMVTAHFFGFVKRQAVYREHLGCTLAISKTPAELRLQSQPLQIEAKRNESRPTQASPLPMADLGQVNFDKSALRAVIDEAFSEPDPNHLRQTRAVIIVQNGKVLVERYAAGFTREMPMLGWSMTKSVINALVGCLVQQGKIDIFKPINAPEWHDQRKAINLDQLLRMSSGLKFEENYVDPFSGVLNMLFGTGDASGYAAKYPLQVPPDTQWYYSSGTTNIISRYLRDVLGPIDYWTYPKRALFDPLGMRSAIMEPDATGVFVGSSFMYATALDWARFGMLYLTDGVWEGKRILPEGWVDYTRKATITSVDKEYGAHFWLKTPVASRIRPYEEYELPSDIFYAFGHEGQSVSIIPSKNMVVVRLGMTRWPKAWDQAQFLVDVLQALAPQHGYAGLSSVTLPKARRHNVRLAKAAKKQKIEG